MRIFQFRLKRISQQAYQLEVESGMLPANSRKYLFAIWNCLDSHFLDFVEFSILLIGRPENASLRRKTRKTIKTLVFDGESNGVGLEKLKKFHKDIVFLAFLFLKQTIKEGRVWKLRNLTLKVEEFDPWDKHQFRHFQLQLCWFSSIICFCFFVHVSSTIRRFLFHERKAKCFLSYY